MSALPRDPARGRYAPSPSGALHLGNLRTALLAWLCARSAGGSFVLRLEDLDRPRVKPGAAEQMLADLRWLGLDWDEGWDSGGPCAPYVQGERLPLYQVALDQLRAQGRLYPCYCSRREIAEAARRIGSAPHGRDDEGPRYPGTCRDLSAAERAARDARGQRRSLRLRVPAGPVAWDDLFAGPQAIGSAELLGDFIVQRADGQFAYQLAVVVDDAAMGIGQVVRGADLLRSTARQLVLYHLLGLPPPAFGHVPLLLDAAGQRLAKREGSAGLDGLRARGWTPEQTVGWLAASAGLCPLGTTISARGLVAGFRRERVRNVPEALDWLPS